MTMKIAFALIGLMAAGMAPSQAVGRDHDKHDNGRHEGRRDDDRRDEWRRDEWRREHWRGHEDYSYGRGYRAPPPVYYDRRPVYTPPPGIFIPFR